MSERNELLRLATTLPQPDPYKALHPELLRIYEPWRRRDALGVADTLRAALGILLRDFDLSRSRVALPASVRSLYDRELERIARQLEAPDTDYFSFSHDHFLKDYALLTHRFVPVGAEFVSLASGVPRRALLAGGVAQALRAVWFVVFTAGGLAPYFELHAHPRSLSDFNPEGWERTYARLADLLRANASMKGVVSASWFFDPALREFSPHLLYLRDVPERHGAAFFLIGTDLRGDSGAIATSATRRRLFEQGAYVPQIYLRVWPRAAILKAWPGG